jgi:hypothetical protein
MRDTINWARLLAFVTGVAGDAERLFPIARIETLIEALALQDAVYPQGTLAIPVISTLLAVRTALNVPAINFQHVMVSLLLKFSLFFRFRKGACAAPRY